MKDSTIETGNENSPNKELIDQIIDALEGKSKEEIDDFLAELRYLIGSKYVLKKN